MPRICYKVSQMGHSEVELNKTGPELTIVETK